MPDLRISQLPVAAALTGTELFELVQGGTNKQGTINDIKTYFDSKYWKLAGTGQQATGQIGIIGDGDAGEYIGISTFGTSRNNTSGGLVTAWGNANLSSENSDRELLVDVDAFSGGHGSIQMQALSNLVDTTTLYDQDETEFRWQALSDLGPNAIVTLTNNLYTHTASNPTNTGIIRHNWQAFEVEMASDGSSSTLQTNNAGLIQLLAQDGTPFDARMVLNVAPESITATAELDVSAPTWTTYWDLSNGFFVVHLDDSDTLVQIRQEVQMSGNPLVRGFVQETLGDNIRIEYGADFTDGAYLKTTDLTNSQVTLFQVLGNIVAKSTIPGFAGITYDIDYSSGYSVRSLVDKGYVDSRFWKNSGTSLLSGGIVDVDIDGNTLRFDTKGGTFKIYDSSFTSGYMEIDLSGATIMGMMGFFGNSGNYLQTEFGLTTNQSAEFIHDGAFIFNDQRGTPRGAQYSTDYSDTMIDNSLANASYAKKVATRTFTFVVGDSTAVSTGEKTRTRYVSPIKGTIVGWKIILDQIANVTLDIWKNSSSVPTNANSITAAAKPTTSPGGTFESSTTLTGWTTAVDVDDVFCLEVEANDAALSITLELVIKPTLA
jgi:hypothetical protein